MRITFKSQKVGHAFEMVSMLLIKGLSFFPRRGVLCDIAQEG